MRKALHSFLKISWMTCKRDIIDILLNKIKKARRGVKCGCKIEFKKSNSEIVNSGILTFAVQSDL